MFSPKTILVLFAVIISGKLQNTKPVQKFHIFNMSHGCKPARTEKKIYSNLGVLF